MSDSPAPTKGRWIDAWIAGIANAAVKKAMTNPYRGILQKEWSPRQYARARGFANAAAMQRHVATMQAVLDAKKEKADA